MKNRILVLVLGMLMMVLLLGGCKGADKKSDDRENNGLEQGSGSEVIEGVDGVDELEEVDESDEIDEFVENENAEEVPYEYVQEWKVIGDNYRNFYEIFVYSFYDSDGDGIGDINGVIKKLDYVNDNKEETEGDLGFNGIWLMPIMPSTTYHKYDVVDYYEIDPQYGTLEDFERLLEECEKRDITLIIDFVFNHTSAKHAWFLEAVSYLEGLEEGEEPDETVCPYVEYYHFTKENNGGATYHKAGRSDWYYECVFWDQMPDLALENGAVRGEIEKIAKYWLDMGVDGFRLDAAKEFYSGETARNVEVLQWFTEYVKSVDAEATIVAEVWDSGDAIANYYESGVPSMFNFPLAQYDGMIMNMVRKLGGSSALSFAKTMVSLSEKYRERNPELIDAPFVSNHDTTRISAQCVNNENQMKMAAGVLLTMSGSPFVYYGEEIGMNSMGSKDENKRLPMNWSATDPAGMPRKPSAADVVEQKFTSVESQLEDPLSILNYYKRAVRIRNENPEIARGEQRFIEELSGKEVCAVGKVFEGNEIVIVYNRNTEAEVLSLQGTEYETLNIRGYLTVDGSVVTLEEGVLELPMHSIVILK